jgi:tetratricopeptide (TPR) repeat protein
MSFLLPESERAIMQPKEIIASLKQNFTSAEISILIRALRQDHLVWDSVQDEAFFNKVISQEDVQVEDWDPANLAFLHLGFDLKASALREVPLHSVENTYRRQAAVEYQQFLQKTDEPVSLESAGLLALALRERRRVKGSWSDLPQEIFKGTTDAELIRWRTPLTCLLSIIPDPANFLWEIGNADNQELILHILLSNPLTEQQKSELLAKVIQRYPIPMRLSFLQALKDAGEDGLAHGTAHAVVEFASRAHSATPDGESLSEEPLNLDNLSEEIRTADYYLALDDAASANAALNRIQTGLRQSEAQVALKLAANLSEHQDDKTRLVELEKVYRSYPDSPAVRAAYSRVLSVHGREYDADTVVLRDTDDLAELVLAAGFENRKSDHGRAAELALKAYGQALVSLQNTDSSLINSLCSLLSNLGLSEEAMDLMNSTARARLNDPLVLLGKSRLEKLTGLTAEAKTSAILSLATAPNNLESHRWLANLYEGEDDLHSAIDEWEEIVIDPNSQSDDSISLARVYYKTGNAEKTIEVCNSTLEKDPNCGQAHLWMGKSLVAQGHFGESIEQFSQAVRLSPEEEEAWQFLSTQQRANGLTTDAYNTLKAAVTAVPGSAQLHFALGEVLQEQGTTTEALMEFSHASELDPQNKSIASAYGSALLNLGRFDEAETILKTVADQYPDDPELANSYAKTLIAQDKHEDALPPMRVVLDAQPKSIDPYLNFANSGLIVLKQIQADDNLPDPQQNIRELSGEIQAALAKGLEFNPDHIQANLLSGDLYLFNREYRDALTRFSHAAELYQGGNARIKCQINYGLGRSALGLESYDVALAALEEAARLDPHQSLIQRDLARAYQQANLPDAAMQTAHNAISLDTSDPDTMVWFSNFCMDMKQDTEAIDAIQSAIHLLPENPELRFQLAKLQSKKGDTSAADETYKGILDIPNLTARILDRISRIFEANNNLSQSINALERLLNENPLPEISIFERLIKVYRQCGDAQSAIQTAKRGLVSYPDDINLNTSLVDLLVETSQINEAMQTIETLVTADLLRQTADLSADKRMLYVQLGLRHVYLSRSLGRISEAFTYSKYLLKMTVNNFEVLYMTADLDHALLKHDHALTRLQNHLNISDDEGAVNELIVQDLINDQEAYDRCICLLAEIALQTGKRPLSAYAVNLLENSTIHDWISAIRSRNVAANFDFQKAHKLLDRALKSMNHGYYHPSPDMAAITEENTPVWNRTTLYYRCFHSPDTEMAVADAALTLQDWDKAIELLEKASDDAAGETLPHLCLAKALVLRAEFERNCYELDVVQNAAGKDSLTEAAYEAIDRHLSAIDLADARDTVTRWKTRAKICFHPDAKSIEAFNQLELDGNETASLIAGAARTNVALDLSALSEKYPNNADVQFQIALALREINPAEGLTAIHIALKAMPVHPLYNALQSILQKNNGDIAGAIQSMNDALDQWPEEHRWHVSLSELYEENDELDKAIEQLQQAIEIDPLNFGYLFKIARYYFEQGDLEVAQKKAKESVLANPDDAQPWMLMANIHKEMGDFEEAISDAERAITLAPNDIAPLVFSARLSLESDLPAQAMDRAQAALRIDPNDSDANLVYIKSLVASGREDEAIISIDAAALESSDPLPILVEKAAIIRETEGNLAALDLLKSLSNEYPDDHRVLKPLAQSLAEEGMTDEALNIVQNGLNSDPDDEDLHLFAGKILRSQGHLDQAIDHLSKTILVDPAGIDAYLELGRTYSDRREFTKAIDVYKQAILTNPDDYRPFYLAALCQREIKNYPDAEKLLKKASELEPDNVNIRRQLGAIIALNLVHKPKEVPVEL